MDFGSYSKSLSITWLGDFMTRIKAIEKIKEIQSGSGVNRFYFPDSMKGDCAKAVWDEGLFTFGMEYGAIIILMEIFNINEHDIRNA